MEICLTTSAKSDIFTGIFQNIRLFTDHISLIFSATGLYLQAMDSSRVSIVEVQLPSNWFDAFNCATDLVIGLNSAILFKILNAREKGQNIHMVYESDDTLSIHFTGEDKTIFDKHFQCPLVDIESETMKIPETEYAAEFTLPSNSYATLIQQLKLFGDTLDMDCGEEKIMMTAKSAESGSMAVEIPIDDLHSFSINEGETLHMGFSLPQLHNISQFKIAAKEMTIKLSDNYPLAIVFPITEEHAFVKVYLAPKISDD